MECTDENGNMRARIWLKYVVSVYMIVNVRSQAPKRQKDKLNIDIADGDEGDNR